MVAFSRFKFFGHYSSKTKFDFILLIVSSITIFGLAAEFDVFERITNFSRRHESLEIDEGLTLLMVLAFSLAIFSLRRWNEIKAEIKVRLATEKELNHLINHDPLTGIPNRTFFNQKIACAMGSEPSTSPQFAVMLLDLNKFKKNQRYLRT